MDEWVFGGKARIRPQIVIFKVLSGSQNAVQRIFPASIIKKKTAMTHTWIFGNSFKGLGKFKGLLMNFYKLY